MKIDLTYKEANILNAILWEIGEESGTVISQDIWRLSDSGRDLCRSVANKLEDANEKVNRKSGKDRDLSGAPKGSIQEARWSA